MIQTLITAVASGSVVAALLSVLTRRRTTLIQQEIKAQFAELGARSTAQRLWKRQAISQLLGPVYMQLDRTERAFRRWSAGSLYLEARVVRVGNETIRDLLLAKPHLIPPDLLEDGGKLIEHYDRWLEEFARLRDEKNPRLDEPFVFVGVGPGAIPFPRDAADRFQQRFRELWLELYGS